MSTVQAREAEVETEGVDGCPECEGEFVDDGLETYCDECGLVEEVHALDRSPSFNKRGERTRSSGANTRLRHDRGIGNTSISHEEGFDSQQLRRMRRLQKQAMYDTKQQRNQIYVNAEITRIGAALGQGMSLREQACALYGQAMEQVLARGRSLDAFAGACILAILRVHAQPFTVEDVADVTRCTASEVDRAYRTLNEELDLPTPPPRPSTYIPRYATELGIDEETEALALEYAKAVEEFDQETGALSGRAPSGIAGACIYHASFVLNDGNQKECLNQHAIGEVIGKTAVTVRTARDILVEAIDE